MGMGAQPAEPLLPEAKEASPAFFLYPAPVGAPPLTKRGLSARWICGGLLDGFLQVWHLSAAGLCAGTSLQRVRAIAAEGYLPFAAEWGV